MEVKNILCKIVFFSPQSIFNSHAQVSWRMLVSICLNQYFKINGDNVSKNGTVTTMKVEYKTI